VHVAFLKAGPVHIAYIWNMLGHAPPVAVTRRQNHEAPAD